MAGLCEGGNEPAASLKAICRYIYTTHATRALQGRDLSGEYHRTPVLEGSKRCFRFSKGIDSAVLFVVLKFYIAFTVFVDYTTVCNLMQILSYCKHFKNDVRKCIFNIIIWTRRGESGSIGHRVRPVQQAVALRLCHHFSSWRTKPPLQHVSPHLPPLSHNATARLTFAMVAVVATVAFELDWPVRDRWRTCCRRKKSVVRYLRLFVHYISKAEIPYYKNTKIGYSTVEMVVGLIELVVVVVMAVAVMVAVVVVVMFS
ncbi:hypothetical protein ANN_11056 [Periplaneta americana]|uniref:Uncharacterized protein n=1 Tax=Periplaneta americana TaxID=6978 RepID=A0ABQ8T3Z2_PERAM|nr:hypothetical protein ANN_11056 [Periplaneta americana]